MEGQIYTPWTNEQVELLNVYQRIGILHPFTCNEHHTLIATNDGWICSQCSDYHQDWAWEAMVTIGGKMKDQNGREIKREFAPRKADPDSKYKVKVVQKESDYNVDVDPETKRPIVTKKEK